MTDSAEQGCAALERSLIDLAVESWRFCRLFGRALEKLDAGMANRYVNQLRYFRNRLEEALEQAGFRLIDLEGQPYDPGIAASPVNLEEFGADEELVVDQMIEPIIMGVDGLRKQGTTVLRRAER